ncbi:competence type IV pilus minor pilin ComGD [Fictibacillus sp. Mic-4]|uniref:competence type IV pilus minor pilin ComGD n=1 Tax=Fictibacillus TaxID=1329200 RepID=UPI0003FC17A9|nr:competence type IV pilus minor pilin ComGD [Fictibacillus gelatini]
MIDILAKKQVKNGGFTLIEMAIVLLILATVLSIGLFSYEKSKETRKVEYFFEELQKDVYLTQRTAIHSEQKASLIFFQKEHYYEIRLGNDQVLKRKQIPQDFIVFSTSMKLQIAYNRIGNVIESGTLHFQTPVGDYRMVILLGVGRFYVERW